MSDFLRAMSIAAAGLSAQRTRMEVIASNLANAETTRTPAGGPYVRQRVVLQADPAPPTFERLLEERAAGEAAEGPAVRVAGVRPDPRPPRLVYDPGHPDANAEGFVSLPNVNVLEEMTDMMTAMRIYEANVKAVQATKHMAHSALEIGK
ncbi:MAG: flagellar basal body rod protein FlgC [Nitrospirae bacterium]|nr:MAG: flagellar basal body rod protein FlgC [Nitrospirota bacterium]